jgi:hypothetical protein
VVSSSLDWHRVYKVLVSRSVQHSTVVDVQSNPYPVQCAHISHLTSHTFCISYTLCNVPETLRRTLSRPGSSTFPCGANVRRGWKTRPVLYCTVLSYSNRDSLEPVGSLPIACLQQYSKEYETRCLFCSIPSQLVCSGEQPCSRCRHTGI